MSIVETNQEIMSWMKIAIQDEILKILREVYPGYRLGTKPEFASEKINKYLTKFSKAHKLLTSLVPLMSATSYTNILTSLTDRTFKTYCDAVKEEKDHQHRLMGLYRNRSDSL